MRKKIKRKIFKNIQVKHKILYIMKNKLEGKFKKKHKKHVNRMTK